jgi:tRNA/tmRNA/rRNA uracil-C5-methylase (TrmA/RlmC/RlmD family)
VADASANLADLGWARVSRGRVTARTLAEIGAAADLVVLDPPRAGAGQDVMASLAASDARAIGYVSCDPASLARDVHVAIRAGWQLASLAAFDAFPMTHHVETVAGLVRR